MEIKYTVTPTPEGAEVEEITAVGGPGDWIETDVDDVCIGATGYRSEICANGEFTEVNEYDIC